MKMDQIGLCQTWHVSGYEGSLRSVLSHSALQLNYFIFLKKEIKAQLCSLEDNSSQILTVRKTGMKCMRFHLIFTHKQEVRGGGQKNLYFFY